MRPETAQILSFLDQYKRPTADDDGRKIASDFRKRRVEKNFTREDMAQMSGVANSNIARFEQSGQISLKNLLKLANALGYRAEAINIFAESKFSTTEELMEIRRNTGKKKAYPRRKENVKEDD